MSWGLLAGIAAAALFAVGALVQARAVRALGTLPDGLWGFVRVGVRHPVILSVVALYLGGFVLHAVAIVLLPLYLAQAAIALQLPLTALGVGWLDESVHAVQWFAVLLVSGGLVVLALGAGEPGSAVTTWPFALALWAGLAVVLVLALTGLTRHGATLGTLAGMAYAGSALAVRGLDWPASAAMVVAALAVGLHGLAGFWLYSLALERAQVNAATAPLIVVQTFAPALVGVLALGDGIRAGWEVPVVVGLLAAVIGAVLVGRVPVSR